MQTSLFITVVVLHALCDGQKICDVFPKNQLVKFGSDVVVFFKAPVNSVCHNKTGFDPSLVSWKLNNRIIPDGYYNMTDDSTFSVSIPNFSLTTGTVEFLMDGNVLSGTLVRTYSIPQNISCIGKIRDLEKYVTQEDSLTCTWDHDQHTTNTSYKVILKLYDEKLRWSKEKFCWSKEKSCKIEKIKYKSAKMAITVIAETPAENATSDEVTYADFFATVKLNPPKITKPKPELNGLRVKWMSQLKWNVSFEVRFLAAGSEPVVKNVRGFEETTIKLTELKECANYSISVRCKPMYGVWSEWSQNVTHLTYLNVSKVQIHLWRSRSVAYGKGERRVHLMWKGIPPSCKAFDEYRLFDRTHVINLWNFSSYKNHTFIYLDENMHIISVAAFGNNKNLAEASITIPSTEEDLILPPVTNVKMSAGGGQIYVTWDKPNLTVSGYLIVWNSTEQNHMWQNTEETHFSLKGQNATLYTISLTPLYKNSPGGEIRLHAYAQENAPPAADLNIRAERISDRKAEIHWRPILPTECCALVLNYTVFYEAQHDTGFRNVTVDKNQHSVMLDNLKPSTTYVVYVQVNAAAASSESSHYTFSTKAYGEDYLIGLIMCGVGLIVCVVFIIVLQKKYVSEKFPNPRLSSLSMWSTQKCKNSWNHLAMTWGSESEKILKCQVEAEDRDGSILTVSTADHNFPIQETTMTTTPEKENTDLVRPNGIEFACYGKEEKRQPLQPVDHQTLQNRPALLTQSPYRIQSPVTSPVDSPKRAFRGTAKPRSSETEMLLKPKPQNTALPTTYVTVAMFEQIKRSTK